MLKNPIAQVLKDINFSSILKQSNFIKRDIGVSPYMVILQFLYMFLINKKISTFIKYSNDSFKKDVYYRLLKNGKYNWRKLLLNTSVKLISRLSRLQKTTDTKVFIIDDTVEVKRGKYIHEVRTSSIEVIARVAKSNRIWQFTGKYKSLQSLYESANKIKSSKLETTTLLNTLMFQLLLPIKH